MRAAAIVLATVTTVTPSTCSGTAVERAEALAPETLDDARARIAAEREIDLAVVEEEQLAADTESTAVELADQSEANLTPDGDFGRATGLWSVAGDATLELESGRMRLVARDGESTWAARRFLVPDNAHHARLEVVWRAEEREAIARDSLDVFVVSSGTTRLIRSLRPLPERPGGQAFVDLSPFMGQEITLVFKAMGAQDTIERSYWLDDIAVTVSSKDQPLEVLRARFDFVLPESMFELALLEDALGGRVWDQIPGFGTEAPGTDFGMFAIARGFLSETPGTCGPGLGNPSGFDIGADAPGGMPWDGFGDALSWANQVGGALAMGVNDPSAWRATSTQPAPPTPGPNKTTFRHWMDAGGNAYTETETRNPDGDLVEESYAEQRTDGSSTKSVVTYDQQTGHTKETTTKTDKAGKVTVTTEERDQNGNLVKKGQASGKSSGTSTDIEDGGDDSGRMPLIYKFDARTTADDGVYFAVEMLYTPRWQEEPEPSAVGGLVGSVAIASVSSEIATSPVDDDSTSGPNPFSKPQLVPVKGMLVIDPISIRVDSEEE